MGARVLFVDDEPAILAGLRNMLYKERKRWDIVFAQSAQHALEECQRAPFDLVISDMRMPGMDGASLLHHIKDAYPATVRIMLTGHADREAIVRALPALHQLLCKPCDAKTMRRVIERSLDPDHALSARLRTVVCKLERLPSPPAIYLDLAQLMASPAATLAEVTALVARDPALSAKALQLASSPYFGGAQATSSIPLAVELLGTEQLQYISLTTSVFSPEAPRPVPGFSFQALQASGERAAMLARSFLPAPLADLGFASALLHDIGRIAFATGLPDEYQQVLERVTRTNARLSAIESELLGATHTDVGAWLLALWGLPEAIVEVVRAHHDPASAPEHARLIAGAVHVAHALSCGDPERELDLASLERAGLGALVPEWRARAALGPP